MTTGPSALEDRPHPLQHAPAECGEGLAAMVDGRHVDGAQHPVRHVGRAGDLQEVASGVCAWDSGDYLRD